MNAEIQATPGEAVTQLFFHCCFKDGAVSENELNVVSEKLVAISLNKQLNFKEEMIRYRTHRDKETNEAAYIQKLIAAIQPENALALYAFCMELCVSDGSLHTAEEQLLQKIAAALNLTEEEQSVCKKLTIERKAVEREKQF